MVERRWYSPRNAATYLDVSVGTIYAWVADGTLPAARICRRSSRGVGRHAVTLRLDKFVLDRVLEEKSR